MKTRFILLLFLIFGCVDKESMEKARQSADKIIEGLSDENVVEYFPDHIFSDVEIRRLSTDLRENCDYDQRVGKFVDYFYQGSNGADRVYFIYEYFLRCDSLRLVLEYELNDKPELIYFRVEQLESENDLIIDRSKGILTK